MNEIVHRLERDLRHPRNCYVVAQHNLVARGLRTADARVKLRKFYSSIHARPNIRRKETLGNDDADPAARH